MTHRLDSDELTVLIGYPMCRGGCGRRLRRKSQPPSDDTVANAGGWFCEWCIERHYGDGPEGRKRKSAAVDERMHAVRRGIENDRRARGIPPNGVRPSRMFRR